MLRNRSRAVTTKQALMAEHNSLSSPSQNIPKPISYFFGSPKFFNGFVSKGLSESKKISPTSILDPPFGFDKTQSIFPGKKQHSWENLNPKGISLALEEKTDKNLSQPNSRMVLFGSKLKIQIPPTPTSSVFESPKTPSDFGIKTRNSLSPFGSVNSSNQTKDSPWTFSGPLSVTEMELSEDYTCVISHGPNPKTTHIYDDCIVESCCGVVGLSELKRECCSSSNSPSESFLSFCYTCKKSLQQGKDVYMYRGEKAFCSRECRCQEMLFDGIDNPAELDDAL